MCDRRASPTLSSPAATLHLDLHVVAYEVRSDIGAWHFAVAERAGSGLTLTTRTDSARSRIGMASLTARAPRGSHPTRP